MNIASVLTFACTKVAAQPPPTPEPTPPVDEDDSLPEVPPLPTSSNEPPVPLARPAVTGGEPLVATPAELEPEPPELGSPTTLPPAVLSALQPVGPARASSETLISPDAIQTFRPIASMMHMASPRRVAVNSPAAQKHVGQSQS